jgi:hypothetical protein
VATRTGGLGRCAHRRSLVSTRPLRMTMRACRLLPGSARLQTYVIVCAKGMATCKWWR